MCRSARYDIRIFDHVELRLRRAERSSRDVSFTGSPRAHDDRHCGPLRHRQDDHLQPARALLRPAAAAASRSADTTCSEFTCDSLLSNISMVFPERLPLQRHDPREHPLRQARRDGGRDDRRSARGAAATTSSWRCRSGYDTVDRRRAATRFSGGAEAAALHRTRDLKGRAHHHPGRGDGERRPGERAPHPAAGPLRADAAARRSSPSPPPPGDHREMPTRSLWWQTAGSLKCGTHQELLKKREPTADLSRQGECGGLADDDARRSSGAVRKGRSYPAENPQ